jgi:hypothetical protein
VLYNDNTYLIQDVNSEKPYSFENAKGVCSFTNKIINTSENDVIYYVKFKIPALVENKLKDYVKGYFFVR